MKNSNIIKTLALSALIPFSMWGQAAAFEDFQYEITAENTVTITGYAGTNTEVSIPSEIEGLPVTAVGAEAFMESGILTRIEIPDTVILIDERAFKECASLSKVFLKGKEELTIRGEAFAECASLKGVYFYSEKPPVMEYEVEEEFPFYHTEATIYYPISNAWKDFLDEKLNYQTWYPESIYGNLGERYGDYYYRITEENTVVISGYEGIEDVPVVPSEIEGLPVTVIASTAFNDNAVMENIVLPESLVCIEDNTFKNCVLLKSIRIPAGVELIGNPVNTNFLGFLALSTSLESIEVDPENQNYKSEEGILFSKDGKRLIVYPHNYGQSFYRIPDTVEKIEVLAFAGDQNLEELEMGDNVKEIGHLAFLDCEKLTKITFGNGVQSMEMLISYCPKLTSLDIPDSVENITGAIRNCESLTSLTIGKGAKSFTLVGVNCPKLERVDVDAENPWISSEDGVVFNKDKSEMLFYPPSRPGEEYEVPDTVKRIMSENNSLQLKKVIFPACLKELSSEWILREGEIYFKGNLPQLSGKPESTASIYYLEGMSGWQAGQAPEGWGSGFQTVEPWSLPEDSAELYLGKREQSAEGKNMLNLVFGGMLESSVDQQTWSEVTSVSPYQAEIDPDKKVFYRVRALTAE